MIAEFVRLGNGEHTYLWHIPAPRKDAPAKERQVYEDLTKRLGRYDLMFRGGDQKHPAVFRTADPVVAKFVRTQIKARKLRAKELLRVPLACPFCDFKTKSNLPADRKIFDDHLFADHADDLAAAQAAQEAA